MSCLVSSGQRGLLVHRLKRPAEMRMRGGEYSREQDETDRDQTKGGSALLEDKPAVDVALHRTMSPCAAAAW